MAARLNVTEAERLCYSRRTLQALSALRNAGLDESGVVREKEPRPDRSGRFYRLTDPEGKPLFFHQLAADCGVC